MARRDPAEDLLRYRVGGCVRDRLLGRPVKDVDWVVVGADDAAMRTRGFQQVGKDFPVYLHPHTKEEHALARTEHKTGPGYTGFEIDARPSVTLEEDLARRDLTINAIAETPDGDLVDPFGGVTDLEDGVLRHVGPAFHEDPLRVLRVARFAARLGFRIAPETLALLTQMAVTGELEHLTPERVWTETEKALASVDPTRYFEVLHEVGALAVVFPELAALDGVEQPAEHHPEGCAWTHTRLTLRQATRLTPDPVTRFGALVHDLGKGLTPREQWPAHHGHEAAGVPLVEAMTSRLRAPNDFRRFGALSAELHTHHHRALEMRPGSLVKLLGRLKTRHGDELLERFLVVGEADLRGRTGFEDRAIPQAPALRAAAVAARAVRPDPSLEGPAVGAKLHQDRCAAVRRALQELGESPQEQ
jgi:tRNA nucleotidyltransferase (CCA-adding enzyme)